MKRLKICHVNVRSLLANLKLLDLELLCASADVDVLCVTETWLSSKVASSQVSLPGFQPPFQCDRATRHQVGLLCMSGLASLPVLSSFMKSWRQCVCKFIYLSENFVCCFSLPSTGK